MAVDGTVRLPGGVADHRAPTRIRGAAGTDDTRSEQVTDAGCPYCPVISRSQFHVLNRCVLDAKLVGIGVEPGGVARIAVARLERQLIRGGQIVQQRQARFSEYFRDVETAIDGSLRTVAAGVQAVFKNVIRIDV